MNLITGFPGSGKTTTLLHLLANKSKGEKWAVLVNEFGEMGIDGARQSLPPDSRIEIIYEEEADRNKLQASLLKLRLPLKV